MESKLKESRFDIYCRSCKFFNTPGFEDPCDECLNAAANEDSHKPIAFEKAGPYINYLEPDRKSYTRDYRKSKYGRTPTKEELKLYFELKDGDYWEKKEVQA